MEPTKEIGRCGFWLLVIERRSLYCGNSAIYSFCSVPYIMNNICALQGLARSLYSFRAHSQSESLISPVLRWLLEAKRLNVVGVVSAWALCLDFLSGGGAAWPLHAALLRGRGTFYASLDLSPRLRLTG